jgi:hypothetical protein
MSEECQSHPYATSQEYTAAIASEVVESTVKG